MKRKTITIDEVLALGPCEGYERPRLEQLAAGRKRLNVAQVVALEIPATDRVWLLTEDHFFTAAELDLFARWCAWQVRDLWKMPDIVRQYLLTGDEKIKGRARDAARAAVRAAWWDAVRATLAALASAWWAAWWSAVRAAVAARDTAWWAAFYAADATDNFEAAREHQLQALLQLAAGELRVEE